MHYNMDISATSVSHPRWEQRTTGRQRHKMEGTWDHRLPEGAKMPHQSGPLVSEILHKRKLFCLSHWGLCHSSLTHVLTNTETGIRSGEMPQQKLPIGGLVTRQWEQWHWSLEIKWLFLCCIKICDRSLTCNDMESRPGIYRACRFREKHLERARICTTGPQSFYNQRYKAIQIC